MPQVEQSGYYRFLYINDGQRYISQGLTEILDKLISNGKIPPVIVVFLDPRNPVNAKENWRNELFWCNPEFLKFFGKELIPEDRVRTGLPLH